MFSGGWFVTERILNLFIDSKLKVKKINLFEILRGHLSRKLIRCAKIKEIFEYPENLKRKKI